MKIVAQRAHGDCGVAALATFLGMGYEDVYVAAAKIDQRRGKKGLSLKELIAVAARLGVTLERRTRPDLDEHEGVLNVTWGRSLEGYTGHFVVLYNGMIVDPDGPQILPHYDWFKLNPPGRPGHLLEAR